MILKAREKADLKAAILKTYREEELGVLLTEEMDLSYEEIARGGDYKTRVFNLIQNLESEGRLEDFIAAIKKKKPNSPYWSGIRPISPIFKNNNEQATPKEDFRKSVEPLIIKKYELYGEQADWESDLIICNVIDATRRRLVISEEDAKNFVEEICKPYKDYQYNINSAIETLEKKVNQDYDPNNDEDFLNILNMYQIAVESFKIDHEIASIIYNNLGRQLYQQKKLEKSIIIFQEALNFDPSNAECYSDLGMALYKLGHLENALENFEIAKILFQQEEKDDMVKLIIEDIEIVTKNLKN